jgi:hypothetical protein
LTPEEVRPPPELCRLHQALGRPLMIEVGPVTPAESLVPAEAGVAMPRSRWRQGKPPKARDIEFGMTPSDPANVAAAHDRSL